MKALGAGAALCCLLGLMLWTLRPALPDDPPIALSDTGQIDTIAVFGTSLSHPSRYSWPSDLAAALSKCQGQPVQLHSVAQAGANSDWAVEQIENVSHAKPDVIVLEFAINDSDLMDGLSLAHSQKNHIAILDGLRAQLPNARIVLLTTNPVSGLHWLKRYRLGAYFRLYSSLAAQYDTGLIHMHPQWRGRAIPDGVHPQNEDASAVMVPHLLGTISGGRCPLPG